MSCGVYDPATGQNLTHRSREIARRRARSTSAPWQIVGSTPGAVTYKGVLVVGAPRSGEGCGNGLRTEFAILPEEALTTGTATVRPGDRNCASSRYTGDSHICTAARVSSPYAAGGGDPVNSTARGLAGARIYDEGAASEPKRPQLCFAREIVSPRFADRRRQGDQDRRVPRRADAGRRARARPARPRGARRDGRRRRAAPSPTPHYERVGARIALGRRGLGDGRAAAQGEGADRSRSTRGCARGSSSSRTSTSPPTSRSRARSSTAASPPSPTRPSRPTTARCRCSRR